MRTYLYLLVFSCSSLFAGVDEYIEKTLSTFEVPGASVAVIRNGDVILKKGYGTAFVGKDIPVNEETLFSIGSLTKAFTALLCAQAVEEGRLQWDDPVIKYFPEFSGVSRTLTIRDLLAHRTGYLRYDPVWILRDVSKDDIITLLEHAKPAYEVGTTLTYNNYMYAVIGCVIEKILGISWEEAILSRIFIPLGMHDSCTSPEGKVVSRGHASMQGNIQTVPYSAISGMKPAMGIYSSLSDMIKWAKGHKTLVTPKTLGELYAISMLAPGFEKGIDGYGLGWFIGNYHDHIAVGHSGLTQGFIADLYMVPEEDLTIITLTNNSTDGLYAMQCIRNHLLDTHLQLEPTDWISNLLPLKCKYYPHTFSPATPDVRYIGHYYDPCFGKVIISSEDGKLYLSYGSAKAQLFAKSENIFWCGIPAFRIFGVPYGLEIIFHDDGHVLEIPFEGFRGSPSTLLHKIS
jgi:CubicO group peptidase (beta-lactamase class C family)